MPGITITPGTAWPVRPLAEVTRPMVWPQPRRSIALAQPDQFQSHWQEDEPVPDSVIYTEERKYRRPLPWNDAINPNGDRYTGAIGLVQPRTPVPALIQPVNSRYLPAANYSVTSEGMNNRLLFEVDHSQVPDRVYNATVMYSNSSFRPFNRLVLRLPQLTCSLLGWPSTVVHSTLNFPSELRNLYPINPTVPEPDRVSGNHSSRPFYFWNFWANEAATGFTDTPTNVVFRELIQMQIMFTLNVHLVGIDGAAPDFADATVEEIDLSDLIHSDTLYHRSVATPIISPPAHSFYSRTCWAGGGTAIFQ